VGKKLLLIEPLYVCLILGCGMVGSRAAVSYWLRKGKSRRSGSPAEDWGHVPGIGDLQPSGREMSGRLEGAFLR